MDGNSRQNSVFSCWLSPAFIPLCATWHVWHDLVVIIILSWACYGEHAAALTGVSVDVKSKQQR